MDYIIETSFEGPGFVAVPNIVAQDARLGADALGVLVWLASLPKGFAVRRQTILERFQIGKDKWQRIARELQAVGALTVETVRQLSGQVARRYRVGWPVPVDENTGAGKSGSGSTGAGKSAIKLRKTRQNMAENPAHYTERKKKQARATTGAHSGRSASPHDAASRPSADRGKAPAQSCGADRAARPDPAGGCAGENATYAQAWRKASTARALGQRWRNPLADTWHDAETPLPESALALIGGAA